MHYFGFVKELYTFENPLVYFPESKLWGHHVVVPPEIVNKLLAGRHTRFLVYINNELKIHSALLSDGNGGRYVLINKDRIKKLGIALGDILHIKIEPDTSEMGMEVPEEFLEVLESDEEAKHYFNQLTKGKQRSLIYLVSKVKRTETKITKALVIMEYLKDAQGKLDFKELNQAFKTANKRF